MGLKSMALWGQHFYGQHHLMIHVELLLDSLLEEEEPRENESERRTGGGSYQKQKGKRNYKHLMSCSALVSRTLHVPVLISSEKSGLVSSGTFFWTVLAMLC